MSWGYKMGMASLQAWLVENPGFRARYKKLLVDSISSQFPNLTTSRDGTIVSHDWSHLLLCGSILAQSSIGKHQDIALRIAQFCLNCSETTEKQKYSAAVIFDSLGNRPAIHLAEQRKLLQKEFQENLPFQFYQDYIKRSIELSVPLQSDDELIVSRFQRKFWDYVSTNRRLSVSAPTSAGKSYIIERWLMEYLHTKSHTTIVYIVPTRALIQQVHMDMLSLLKSELLHDINVSTLPIRSSYKRGASNLYILTQERFLILLSSLNNQLLVDLLIVDEAQKVGDGHRGVLLQQAIDATTYLNDSCKIIYASPMTANPEVLLNDTPKSIRSASLSSEDVMVNQNLLWASQVPRRPKEWMLEAIIDNTPVHIGGIVLTSSPSSVSKRLPFVAFALGNKNGGNVIYVNGAAEAENTAKQLYDLVSSRYDIVDDEDIENLVALIKKTVHKKYNLARVLRRGVAYHYGNMPHLIRIEIERLFSINKIRYLVCTSTLIEGVNMPCQSIYMRGPTKGRGKPISPGDFWNLAGRAGRWGIEFQGNVVCIDVKQPNTWKSKPPLSREKQQIVRTSTEVLSEWDSFIAYLQSKEEPDEELNSIKIKYVVSYIITSFYQWGSVESTTWAKQLSDDQVSSLQALVSMIVSDLSVPREVVLRNPGISPFDMDRLLEYFTALHSKNELFVEEISPVPVESEDAVSVYTKILGIINSYLGNEFGSGGRIVQLALLITDWMKGYPLAKIIASRESYYLRNKREYKIATLIRDTMKDVEQYARYQAPKYLSCYVDILSVHLERIGREDLKDQLFDLNVLLEFGVSQKTQLSLMGLGLSRSSAIAISEFISQDSLCEDKCLEWLRENNWMAEDLPELIKREIRNLLDIKG